MCVLLWADHIPTVFEFPVSDVPIPYTELLITAVPGYKQSGKSSIEGAPRGAQPDLPTWLHATVT